MSKKLKVKQVIDLPYWPSQAFIKAATEQLRLKGVVGTAEELSDMIHQGYWTTRDRILKGEKP